MGQIRIGRKHLASHIGGGLVPVSVIIYRISKTVVGDGGQLVSRIAIGGCDCFCAIDVGYLSQPVVIGIIRVIDCVSQRVGFRCQQTVSRVIGVGSSPAAGVCDGADISAICSVGCGGSHGSGYFFRESTADFLCRYRSLTILPLLRSKMRL